MTEHDSLRSEDGRVEARQPHRESANVSQLLPRIGGLLIALGIVVVAGIIAPGPSPDWWTWARLLGAWSLSAFAITTIIDATFNGDRPPIVSPLAVWGSLLASILLSLTLTPASAALGTLALVLMLFNLRSGQQRQPPIFWLSLATLSPVWAWAAFDALTWWLLMLVPVALAGLISLEHARRAGDPKDGFSSRLACWIWISGAAALVLAASLLGDGDVDPGWVASGCITAMVIGSVDLLLPPTTRPRSIPSSVLPLTALLALGLAWLVAL